MLCYNHRCTKRHKTQTSLVVLTKPIFISYITR